MMRAELAAPILTFPHRQGGRDSIHCSKLVNTGLDQV